MSDDLFDEGKAALAAYEAESDEPWRRHRTRRRGLDQRAEKFYLLRS